jgi:hypothetical protein
MTDYQDPSGGDGFYSSGGVWFLARRTMGRSDRQPYRNVRASTVMFGVHDSGTSRQLKIHGKVVRFATRVPPRATKLRGIRCANAASSGQVCAENSTLVQVDASVA